MKQMKIWSIWMLAAMMPLFMACGKDDDNSNTFSSYTASEIIGILTGKWDVLGEYSYVQAGEEKSGAYSGKIEFGNNNKYSFKANDENGELKSFILKREGNYNIIKENGKTSLEFDDLLKCEILSLSKGGFSLSGFHDEPVFFYSADGTDTFWFMNEKWHLTINSK